MDPLRAENRSSLFLRAPIRSRAVSWAIQWTIHLAVLAGLLLFCGLIFPNRGTTAANAPAMPGGSIDSGTPARPVADDASPSLSVETLDPATVRTTKTTERPAAAGLHWLARHQMNRGNWSLQGYPRMCQGPACGDIGEQESLSAATGAALLPFLAAGQTHRSRGPFQKTILHAVTWLLTHQRPSGDLSADSFGKQPWMHAHALATIALCECFGMSRDRAVGRAAQKAVNFIQNAQLANTGGWAFRPAIDRNSRSVRSKQRDNSDFSAGGDMSIVAWELMALKSAQMAGLSVDPALLQRAGQWLKSAAVPGNVSDVFTFGRFSYRPGGTPSLTASAMGLWCKQALHARRDDSAFLGGVPYLMNHLPDRDAPNIVYWYFANQVMFNMADRNWDVWNRKMRAALIATQIHEGCAAGSWDADKPNGDIWGAQAGRLMTTSFATLILVTFHRSTLLLTIPTF